MSERSPIDPELVRRWSLYLTWVFGVDVPDSAYEASSDACMRGEEPPDNGWAQQMARRAEQEVWIEEEEEEVWRWGDPTDRIPWDEDD